MNINVPWCPCGSIGAPDVVEEDELCQNALDRFERQRVNFMDQPNITKVSERRRWMKKRCFASVMGSEDSDGEE